MWCILSRPTASIPLWFINIWMVKPYGAERFAKPHRSTSDDLLIILSATFRGCVGVIFFWKNICDANIKSHGNIILLNLTWILYCYKHSPWNKIVLHVTSTTICNLQNLLYCTNDCKPTTNILTACIMHNTFYTSNSGTALVYIGHVWKTVTKTWRFGAFKL